MYRACKVVVIKALSLGWTFCALRIAQVDVEDGLVRLKDHAGVHAKVLIQIQPRAVRARLVVFSIAKNP